MYKEALRPVWAEINLSNLDYNIKNIKAKIGDREMIGVIKADAYGHGSVKVAEVLRENGCKTFAIATLQEAVTLREAGAKEEIIMLGLTPDMYADTIVNYDITPVVCDFANAKAFSDAAAKAGKTVSGLIAVDTGMGRIGYNPDSSDALDEILQMSKLENFKIKGLFSHMSTADETDKTYAHWQADRFKQFAEKIESCGIPLPVKTFANSAAIIDMPETYYDKVRAGLIIFGYYPSDEVNKSALKLKPAMSVKASIIQLKKVPKGTYIGYNRKFIAERDSLIATIPVGYADGLPRAYSSTAKAIVNGTIVPFAGNICMDQSMIDVTELSSINEGDEVTIIGSDNNNQITASDIAKASGTIPNEILCGFGQRLYKKYV